MVLAQASGSHLGGAIPLSGELHPDFWADAGCRSKATTQHRLLDELGSRHMGKRFWRQGDVFTLAEGLKVRVLWPPPPESFSRLEDNGLVLQFCFPNGKLIYAGDISAEIEARLLGETDLQSDCLVQGEHSLVQNLSSKWLEKIKPLYIIRPVRGFQSDCSLTPDFWKQVEKRGTRVLRMEDTGAVFFEIGKEGCHIATWVTPLEYRGN